MLFFPIMSNVLWLKHLPQTLDNFGTEQTFFDATCLARWGAQELNHGYTSQFQSTVWFLVEGNKYRFKGSYWTSLKQLTVKSAAAKRFLTCIIMFCSW